MKHPKTLKGYENSQTTARDFSNMRYDAIAEHYEQMEEFFKQDSLKDANAGRLKVASILEKLAKQNKDCQKTAEQLWQVCKKYMPEE